MRSPFSRMFMTSHLDLFRIDTLSWQGWWKAMWWRFWSLCNYYWYSKFDFRLHEILNMRAIMNTIPIFSYNLYQNVHICSLEPILRSGMMVWMLKIGWGLTGENVGLERGQKNSMYCVYVWFHWNIVFSILKTHIIQFFSCLLCMKSDAKFPVYPKRSLLISWYLTRNREKLSLTDVEQSLLIWAFGAIEVTGMIFTVIEKATKYNFICRIFSMDWNYRKYLDQ